MTRDQQFSHLFNRVRQYADEHNLSVDDIKTMFDVGIVTRAQYFPASQPTTEETLK